MGLAAVIPGSTAVTVGSAAVVEDSSVPTAMPSAWSEERLIQRHGAHASAQLLGSVVAMVEAALVLVATVPVDPLAVRQKPVDDIRLPR